MATGLPPGIGNPQQALQATAFMRQQPWYQQLLRSWGVDPNQTDPNGNPLQKLSDSQQNQLLQTAQNQGIGISPDSYHIDENGQIAHNDSHVLRNILLGAGAGGLALTGIGAAGIGPLAGLFGGAGAAGAGAGAALPAATGAGSLSATSLGLPAAAGLGTAGGAGGSMSLSGILGGLLGGGGGSSGGSSGILSKILPNLSQVLGGAAGGQAAQQSQQGQLATQQGNLQQQLYNDALNRFTMGRVGLPSQGASMAARGDLLANVKDVVPTMTPGAGYSFSGGIRPSALGPNARQAGANLSNAGLNLQSAQGDLPALPNFPNISTQPGGLQQALQYGALGSGVLGALGGGQPAGSMPPWLQNMLKSGGGANQANPAAGLPAIGPQDPDPYGLGRQG